MDLFNFVKNQADIIAVITEYSHLKKTGSHYWKALCPFHHEKTPSFTVSPHKKIFYCFGCHKTGDVIYFIEQMEHISALQAAQHLIQRYSIDIPDYLKANQQQIKQEKTIFQLCNLVAQWCNTQLLKHKNAQNYLQERHINPAACSQFTLGYFPHGPKAIADLLDFVLNKGFSSQELLQEHIVFQGNTGLYSPFEQRIIFPIKDHLGYVCGFGGRIFLPHDNRPKYYNSKESNIFKKSKILFGFDIAKHEIQKQKSAFIVEGYTDCIAMHQQGYVNTVATLGTACSIDHLKQLEKHAQTIYMLYDADNAGKQAILRLAHLCWQLELELKVILLPAGHDPASLLAANQSPEPYIARAKDIFTYVIQSIGQEFQTMTIKDKMAALTDLIELICNISDPLRQNFLLMKTAEHMQIPLDILKKEYAHKNKVTNTPNSEQATPKEIIVDQKDELEQQILAIAFHDSSVITKQHEILLHSILSESQKTIFAKITKQAKEDSQSDLLTEQELQQLRQRMFSIESSDIKQVFANLMLQFQKKHWKSLTSHIKIKLMQAKQAQNKEEIAELLELFESLKKTYIKMDVYDKEKNNR